jgi:AsmA protein
LTGTGVVARGVITNNDLAGQLPFMRIDGRGKVDLAQETLDYRLGVEILDTPGVEAGAGAAELRGHTIPVHISGPFDELNYRVDVAEVLKEEAKSRIEDAVRDKLKDIFP